MSQGHAYGSIHLVVKVNLYPGDMKGEITNKNHSENSELVRQNILKIRVFGHRSLAPLEYPSK